MRQLIAIGRTVWGPKVPTLKGTELSLPYVQCFLCLVPSSVNVSIFHITCLGTFWTELVHINMNNWCLYFKLVTLLVNASSLVIFLFCTIWNHVQILNLLHVNNAPFSKLLIFSSFSTSCFLISDIAKLRQTNKNVLKY